jgi:hypothetical protein
MEVDAFDDFVGGNYTAGQLALVGNGAGQPRRARHGPSI